jgi:putative aminopeptidase FrvX
MRVEKEKLVKSNDLLRRLCHTPALAGFEEPMIRLMREEMGRYTNRVQVDRLGNVIATLPAVTDSAATLMIAAHMDELGFIVRKIEPDGFLRLHRLGGIPERVLAARVLAVHTDDGGALPAVVGTKSHHVTPPEEKYVVVPVGEVYVDMGLPNAESVTAAGVRVGSPVTYWPFFEQVGDVIMSKTLDDRLGCYAMLRVLEKLAGQRLPVNVVCVATVQEEFSGRGNVTAAVTVQPDLAIALDVGVACDTPDLKSLADIALGQGPIINTYMFHPRGPLVGTLPNPKLRDLMIATARRHDLPYQLGTFFGGLTDASYMQYVNEGIAVLEVGIPTRYTHTPVEVASLRDAQTTVDLLVAFVLDLPANPDLARG